MSDHIHITELLGVAGVSERSHRVPCAICSWGHSTPMREKIARAIFNASFHPDDVANGAAATKWTEWAEDRDKAFRHADAVLAALADPTGEMLEAADAATPRGMHWSMTGNEMDGARIIWRAMIAAAGK